MKPQPGAPPRFAKPVRTPLDVLSEQIDGLRKNHGGVKELETKIDELANIIKSCPHCRRKLEG